MEKVNVDIISENIIKSIKIHQLPIDIGSDISCYLFDKDTVIKTFEITCKDPDNKFFIPNSFYGNDSYIFTNSIQKNHDGLLLSYTQPYIRGELLNPYNFNDLSIDELLNWTLDYFQSTENKV